MAGTQNKIGTLIDEVQFKAIERKGLVWGDNRPVEMRSATLCWKAKAIANGFISWWSDTNKAAVSWDGVVVMFGRLYHDGTMYVIELDQPEAEKQDAAIYYDLDGWEV